MFFFLESLLVRDPLKQLKEISSFRLRFFSAYHQKKMKFLSCPVDLLMVDCKRWFSIASGLHSWQQV